MLYGKQSTNKSESGTSTLDQSVRVSKLRMGLWYHGDDGGLGFRV